MQFALVLDPTHNVRSTKPVMGSAARKELLQIHCPLKHLSNIRTRNALHFFHLQHGIAFLENVTDYRNQLKFPSDEDLNGAAVALMRLQDTYQLETASIARGELNGVQYRCVDEHTIYRYTHFPTSFLNVRTIKYTWWWVSYIVSCIV